MNMNYTVFSGMTGSRLYGCATEDSDTDITVIEAEQFSDFVYNGPTKAKQTIKDDIDLTVVRLNGFVRNLVNGSPNSFELLYHPSPNATSPVWDVLVDNRNVFLSLDVVSSFAKAAASQLARTSRDHTDWKAVATSYRWASEAVMLLEEEAVRFPLPEEILDEYIAIRGGALSYTESVKLVDDKLERYTALRSRSVLKESVNETEAKHLTVRLYRLAWGL